MRIIDVAALRSAAEAKLVKVPPETNAPETNAPETDAPETDAPETEADTEADIVPVKKGCGGCNSSAAISAAIIVGMVGVALTTKKRRR